MKKKRVAKFYTMILFKRKQRKKSEVTSHNMNRVLTFLPGFILSASRVPHLILTTIS